MTARRTGPKQGTIFCDTKTFTGPCRKEFESLEDEPYEVCLRRALEAGWATDGRLHLCPDHKWLMLGSREKQRV